MRFSANIGFLWAQLPLLARIDSAARAGFRAIEMHWPYGIPAVQVAEAVRRNRVSLLGINSAPGRLDIAGARPWRQYRACIGNVQIAGVPARAEPDEGEIAYPAIFELLDRLEYDGWIGCEYRPRGDTDDGLSWMARLGLR